MNPKMEKILKKNKEVMLTLEKVNLEKKVSELESKLKQYDTEKERRASEHREFPNEVYFSNPSLRFVCKNRSITLRRVSGGRVEFVLLNTELLPDTTATSYYVIDNLERFEYMWDAIAHLNEVPDFRETRGVK